MRGKAADSMPCTILLQDHPRLCGEKRSTARSRGRILGSPPPMRGKASLALPAALVTRITPAYAGKSGSV